MADIRLDDSFGYWLAGFADGEGCFRIHKEKGGTYYACHFQIKLRADDRAILADCQKRTGVGTLKDEGPWGTSKPQVAWIAQSRADCQVIAAIFDRYPLRSKKARDYVIWREALNEWTTGKRGNRWHGPRDWTRMVELKEQLAAVRAY